MRMRQGTKLRRALKRRETMGELLKNTRKSTTSSMLNNFNSNYKLTELLPL
jgi:hypothetical protein